MRIALALIILLTAPFIKAQQHLFIKQGRIKQLPSSECYNVMQDKNGYIWFSTEAGLCRYNGDEVRVYSKKDGIPEGATYSVFEDRSGKVWATTSQNRIIFYDSLNDCFSEATFSKKCQAICKALGIIYFSRMLADSALWFCTQYTSYEVNLKSEAITRVSPPDCTAYYFLLSEKELLPLKSHLTKQTEASVRKSSRLPVVFKRGSQELRLSMPFKTNRLPDSRVLTAVKKNGDCYIAFEEYLLHIRSDLSWEMRKLDHFILSLHTDKDDGLWVGTYKGGALYFSNDFSEPVIDLTSLSVTGIFEDKEGAIWCTTLEKGILYCRSKFVLNYSNINGLQEKAEFLRAWGNRLFIGAQNNLLFEFSNQHFKEHQFAGPSELGFSDIIPYENGWLVANKTHMLKLNADFKNPQRITNFKTKADFGVGQLAKVGSTIFGIQRGTLLSLKGKYGYVRTEALGFPARSIWATSNFGFLLAGKGGLVRMDTVDFSYEKIIDIPGNVIQVVELGSALWVLTKNDGLYIINNGKKRRIDKELGISQYRCSDMIADKDSTLWFATSVGLIKLRAPYTKKSCTLYNSIHGLPADEVSKICAADDQLFVSTSEGLCSFPIRHNLVNKSPPSVFVKSVSINQKRIPGLSGVSFPYDQNNFRIVFEVLSYKQVYTPAKLFYRLSGPFSELRYMDAHELVLNNLDAGNYTLIAYAINYDGTASDRPVILHFEILKPFWLSYWFLAAVLFIFIAGVYFLVKQIIARIRRKEAEKTRVNKLLAEYQMSALRAQMNPHFIFNCINSIQKFVLSNNSTEAYDYLQKFSRLIRLVLNYAEDNLISLEQELEIVELYLELEQLRFDEKFTYGISIAANVDKTDVMVPVMLMQPYIENAIWHGLMNLKSGRGHIRVNIEMENDLLTVLIEDNGIGLERSAELRKDGHKSRALDINSRRTEILNIMGSQTSGSVIIENITDKSGNISGTRVLLKIPQNTYDGE